MPGTQIPGGWLGVIAIWGAGRHRRGGRFGLLRSGWCVPETFMEDGHLQ